MIREATAMTVRKNLGELLNEVHYKHDSVLITKAGKPVAAIIDIEFYKKIKFLKKEFDQMATELSSAYQTSSAEVAEKEIAQAVKTVRKLKVACARSS